MAAADDYFVIGREEWTGQRANTPLTLSEEELSAFRGANEDISLEALALALQALVAQWPDHPQVDLVTTDGFLYLNRKLVADGIMHRKKFSGELRPQANGQFPGGRESTGG
jgi:type I pantothenate kinase